MWTLSLLSALESAAAVASSGSNACVVGSIDDNNMIDMPIAQYFTSFTVVLDIRRKIFSSSFIRYYEKNAIIFSGNSM